MDCTKNLILLTASFPFGRQETFLENEIPILAEEFDKITILHSNKDDIKRSVPTNVDCIHTPLDLNKKETLKSYFHLFKILVWKEILRMLFIYKQMPSIGFFKTLFIAISKGKKMQEAIEKHFSSTELKSSILYSYWCDDHAIGLAFLNKKYNNKLKTISRAHGWDVYFEVSLFNYLPLRSFIHKHLTQLFPISYKGKSYMEQRWKIKDKITVSRLGTSPPPLEGDQGGEHSLKLKNKNDIFTIVTCSNLIPLKRINLIIDALSLIKEIPIHWVHFGDGPEQEKLQQQANEFLSSNIQVEWKGRVTNQTVLEFYKKVKPHLFINVSSSEGIPVSIMEAMSYGIPCIVTNVGGNSEIVDNKNGKLMSSNPTNEELKEIIEYFLNLNETNYSNYQDSAFNTWKKYFNANINYLTFSETLKKI